MPKLPIPIVIKPEPWFIGVDPGQSGGIAVVSFSVKCEYLFKMPETEQGIWELFRDLSVACECRAVIEKVHAMPKQGVSSTFKFGCGYGGLRMALTGNLIPFEEVSPQTWQKQMGIRPRAKTESKNDHKNKLLAAAQRLFPGPRITKATADALLLAEYLRREYRGVM